MVRMAIVLLLAVVGSVPLLAQSPMMSVQEIAVQVGDSFTAQGDGRFAGATDIRIRQDLLHDQPPLTNLILTGTTVTGIAAEVGRFPLILQGVKDRRPVYQVFRVIVTAKPAQ